MDLWEDNIWEGLAIRHLQRAREAGALTVLPLALSQRISAHSFAGELAAGASLIEEMHAATEATGSHIPPYGPLALAAWRGREAEASKLIEAIVKDAVSRGEGLGVTVTQWARAVLDNGLGRYQDALAAAERASRHPEDLAFFNWGLVELIVAGVRSGNMERAAAALERLSEITRASGTDWALGIEARSRALLSEGDAAERLYREAIERLGRTHVRVELGRAHLVYGEWLRRERRRVDAREQLRTAHQMFTAMGLEAFAGRAARELLATGERARKRTARPGKTSPPRKSRSRGSLARGSPIPKSAAGSSSARGPSNTTCTRSSASSASARATSSLTFCRENLSRRSPPWQRPGRLPSRSPDTRSVRPVLAVGAVAGGGARKGVRSATFRVHAGPPEFRREAAELVRSSGCSIPQVAAELGCSPQSVRNNRRVGVVQADHPL